MRSPQVLQSLIADALKDLDFPSTPSQLYDPIRYMLEIGGKRMRPVLVLMGCELFGKPAELALHAALGIEVFHNFTLLHDDIMDQAPLRRAVPTVHTRWNKSIAILSGDAMFVKACQLIMQVPPEAMKPCMDLFLKTALEVCEGQQTDMDFESVSDVSIQDYLSMIRLKTAVLLGCSLSIGAMIASARETDARHLYDFGTNLGMAFQLQDDILDVYGDAVKFGKQTGGDIISNKKTFLLLTALSSADDEKRKNLMRWLSADPDKIDPAEKVRSVTEIFSQLGVRDKAETKMQELYEHALNHLEAIPVTADAKDTLRQLAETLMVRVN